MDETDKTLLKLLYQNGAMHTVEMAAALGVSEDEIVSRMLRMQEEDWSEARQCRRARTELSPPLGQPTRHGAG